MTIRNKNTTKFRAIGRAGGPGTFWEGYEYTIGTYRWRWLAWLRAWWHVRIENPYRAARIQVVKEHPDSIYLKRISL